MLTDNFDDLVLMAKRASFNGLLLLYALCISYKKKRAFNLKDFSVFVFKDPAKIPAYFHGYLIACLSLGLFR